MKEPSQSISLSAFFSTFFIAIGLGAVCASIGAIDIYRWSNNLPARLSPLLSFSLLLAGLVIDLLAIKHFIKHRAQIFQALDKAD